MIALQMICSDEVVYVGRAYLARTCYKDFINNEVIYLVVYPQRKDGDLTKDSGLYRECKYYDGCGCVHKWKEFAELAEIY